MLAGIRVVDLTRLLPGGYCTMLLADLGADVVKIEAAGHGDPLRSLPDGSVYFEALHRGKRSVALRLKTAAGRHALNRLVETADVLIEGFRPGVMERMGLGWEELARINPRLVYCAISGYGSAGPLRERAGHDLNYLARAGALSLMPMTGEGLPAIPSLQVADLGGAVTAAMAILAALIDRARTGVGRRVEIAMTDVVRSWLTLHFAVARAGGAGVDLTGGWPCYHVYAVRDGFLSVAALEPIFWQTFCRAIGREDLIARQADPSAVREVAGVLGGRTRADWMAHFAGRDVCVEPSLSVDELLSHEPAEPRPVATEREGAAAPRQAPALGEHTREVLLEAGLNEAEIDALGGNGPRSPA